MSNQHSLDTQNKSWLERIESSTKSPRYLPWAFLVLALIVRLARVVSNDIQLDEPFLIFWAQAPLSEYLSTLLQDNNPPLFNLIIKLWTSLFGISPMAVRIPAAVFSALTVPVLFRLAQKHFGLLVALASALLLTFSKCHQQFAHDARAYSLLALFTTISMYGLLQLMAGDKRPKMLWIYVMASAGMMYTHFFGVAVFLIQLLSVVSIKQWRLNWRLSRRAILMVTLVYLPYSFVFLYRFSSSVSEGTWVAPVENIGDISQVILYLSNYSSLFSVLILTAFWMACSRWITAQFHNNWLRLFLLCIAGFAFLTFSSFFASVHKFSDFVYTGYYEIAFLSSIALLLASAVFTRKSNPALMLLIFWLILPVCGMYVLSYKAPMYLPRYLIYATPALFLLIAIAIKQMERTIVLPFFAIVLSIFILDFHPKASHRDRKPSVFAKHVKTHQALGSPVIICPPWYDVNLYYYLDRSLFINKDKTLSHKVAFEARAREQEVYACWNEGEIAWEAIKEKEAVLFMDAYSEMMIPENGVKSKLELYFNNTEIIEQQEDNILYRFSN